jgi:hypothetical protein
VALSDTRNEVGLRHAIWSISKLSHDSIFYTVDFTETRRHIAYIIPLNAFVQIIDRERKCIFDEE